MSAAPSKKKQPEEEVDDEEEEDIEGEEDDEFDEDDMEDDGGFGMDIGAMLDPYLATESGETVATALVAISKHMENQNKILIKILSSLNLKK